MANDLQSYRLRLILRLFFIVLLGTSAVTKLLDMPGFYELVRNYQALPEYLSPVAAWLLTLTELAQAIWLASGRGLRAAALAVCALHVFYLVWLSITLMRGLRLANCGCFGAYFARPLTGVTLIEDFAVLTLAFFLWRSAARV